MSISFPEFPRTMGFAAFSSGVRNLWGNPCISHMLKYTIRWESDGKKAPILWEKYEYQFPRLSPYHGFVAFSGAVGNLWGNPYISHMLKYTLGGESDGKKVPILWENYEYQFPRFSPYHGFCCIFPCCGKCKRKPMYFPYDVIG